MAGAAPRPKRYGVGDSQRSYTMDTLVRFGVKDRMTGEVVYKTRKADYFTGHQRAEKWCKANLGERGTIVELN